MTPVKCSVCNLYYDSEKYQECPHCAKGGPLPKPSYTNSEKRPAAAHTSEEKAPQSKVKSKDKSKNLFSDIFKKIKKDKTPEAPIKPKTAIPVREAHTGGEVSKPSAKKPSVVKPSEVITPKAESENVKPEGSGNGLSLGEAIKQAESVPTPTDTKTEARYNFSNDIEPVNGWLVCIKGEYKGDSFNIKSGRNNIGRSLTMDIALAKEKTVSRERHASVIFEPNNREFFIQSGDSSGLTYVNDELVLTVRDLKENDIISLSGSKFMFVSFSGENFTWDDYED